MPIILDGMSFDNTPKPAAAPTGARPATPAKAPNGSPGGPGRWWGTDGEPGIAGVWSSRVPAQNGVAGIPGGNAASAVITSPNVVTDPSNFGWFLARGGNGGPGGDASTPGGNGGAGGNGGPGWGLSPGGAGGDGGPGGLGARGGEGGAGGSGGIIRINFGGTVPFHSANVAGGRGGLPGRGGAGGIGGPGGTGGAGAFGPSPNGNMGTNARPRNDGNVGRAGAAGQIWINGFRVV